jgi:hypothetical protein
MHTKTQIITAVALMATTACAEPQGFNEAESSPLAPPSQALERLSGMAGEYIIVDARRASDVAAPAQLDYNAPIGASVRFTYQGIEMQGASCDEWTVTRSDDPVVFVDSDPNLTDLNLGPTDSPITSGDQREHQGYVAICEEEDVFRFHKVDDRVLVVPAANSSINLILERPLSELQVKAYQVQLKSMKFYDGALTGVLDAATLRASRRWYEDRARLDEETPIPARPAITENLLDALNVLPRPAPE